jgi:predicted nucleic acid-binding protein
LNALVVDASVAVKWALPQAREPLTDESVQLLKRFVDGQVEFIVPDIFWAEIGNVLWKGARQKRWGQSEAETAASQMGARNFATVSSHRLLPEALTIAFSFDRSLYDCLYVALAVESRTDLITADERLANALAARFPVKWLGAY